MKRLLLIILISIVPLISFSQVTSEPSNPTDNEEINIHFDATGTGLEGYTGGVYAFTGVTVNGTQFSNLIGVWGDNVVNPQLTRDTVNPNLYTLLITPSIFDYYSVSATDNITELGFVFRSSDATLQTIPDIFIPIIPTNPPPPPLPRIIGVVGSATPNGWLGPDITLSFDNNSNTWRGNVTLSNGEIKFREDNNWPINYGDDGANGTLDRNGANIAVTAGDYFIIVDTNNLTYSIQSALVSIPDPNFEQALIDLGIDSDGVVNTSIFREDAENATEIIANFPIIQDNNGNDIPNDFADERLTITEKIADLTGIEAFINLTKLGVGYNALTTVNFSNNVKLDDLFLNDNQLTTIDITKNTLLTRFGVMRNPNIGAIDVSKNTLLKELFLQNTGISTINLSTNIDLWRLHAQNNNLTGVDVSLNTKLTDINVRYNAQLTYLDMRNGNNKNITNIDLRDTSVSCINADGTAVPNVSPIMFQYYENQLSTDCGTVYIPDPNFEQALINSNIDASQVLDGVILRSEAASVIDLDVNNKNISSLAGIEHFENLTYLYCHNNLLTALDLGYNPNLINLHCGGNALTSIDLSNYPNLVSLHIWINKLSILDISNNTKLEELLCSSNQLKVMDISSNSKLKFMNFADNKLLNLNIANGNNANFTHPSWADYSFDARYNPALNCIQVDAGIINNIPTDWFKDETASYNENCPIINCEEFVAIPDASFEQALIDLGIDTNGLTGDILKCDAAAVIDLNLNDRNISSLAGIEHFENLTYLYCHNNLLTALDLGNNPNLINLHCGGNALTSIDLSNYPNLVSLHIWINKLSILDVSNNTKLEELLCSSNQLKVMDISSNSKLKFMNFADNKLLNLNIANGNNVNFTQPSWADFSFDARNNPALMCIQVDAGIINNIPSNWFKDETASYNENCPIINCEELVAIPDANFEQVLIDAGFDTNGLTGTIKKCEAASIFNLDLNSKNISSLLGIEHFVNLQYLYCHNNLLTELNLGNKPNLIYLDCSLNALTSIDVSNYPNLVGLSIWGNQLTSLDVSHNLNLEELHTSSNRLTSLDIAVNIKLKFMNFADNKLLNLNIANGNNTNFTHLEWADFSFDARNNPALMCIQVDAGIINNIPTDWFKDETASYNENCPIINCEELVAIPDANFEQALIDLGIDTNGLTGDILKCDAAAAIDLNLNDRNISSLTGIEHFVNLRYLFCNNNKINVLDLSSNSRLMGVLANQNFLTAINISNCPNLETLHLWSNQLTSLNVENNTELKELILLGNNLTSLDVSKNLNLTFLQCNYNQLTNLNIANGNNANFSPPNWTSIAMNASNNPNLNCIQVDEDIIANIPSDWFKDETASYSVENCESSPILYVNDNVQSGDLYTTAIGNNANPGTAALPFATIQHAINKVTAGGVIYVDAGTYIEDVIINKALTLNAVQAGVNPESSLTRGAETIVVSATVDPINRTVFILQASDITIDGFTIDGDNPNITGSVLLNGADINAGFGIAKFNEPTACNNLIIQNNIIKNFYRYGVFIQSANDISLSGNLITQNHFTNISAKVVDGNYGRWGRAIALLNNSYASVSHNIFTKVSTAIWISNFNETSIDNYFITGNIMETYRSGIDFSRFSAGANRYEVNNNHISTGDLNSWSVPAASTTNNNIGIIASFISNTTSQSFNNNTIINTQIGVSSYYNISSIPNWSINVNNNSITETIGYAIQNSDGNEVNATCNWYGSTAVQDNLDKITAQTGYFVPFLTNGTDSDSSTNGFQPIPDSCNGLPLSASVTGKTDVTCFEANNGSINISIDNLFTGKAPYTYLWTKDDEPEFSSSVEDPINLSPGTYRVTITDDLGTNVLIDYDGIIINIEVDINEPEALTASANVINNICFAGNTGSIIVTAFGGTGPYSYSWSNGGVEDQISNLTQGTYTLLITDANGCTSNTQYEVTQPAQIVLQLTDLSTACSNIATVLASGGTGGYTYLWSNGATSQEISAVAAGTYHVTVTDTNGCTMSGSIVLAVKEAFNPSASTTNVSCFGGADGSIIIANVNGQAPFSYSIDGINFFQDQNQFPGLRAGIYTIGVRDANGCTGFVTKTISEPVLIAINVDNVNGTCAGVSSGSISISTSGGSPGYSYSWIGPNGYVSLSKNISNLAPGTYSVTVRDTKNCSTTTSGIVVATTPVIVVTETVTHIACKGETNGSINLAVSGGSGNGFYYSWSVIGAIGSSIGNLTVGNYNVTITDIGTGCAVTKYYSITQPATNVSISVSKINATGCKSMGKITITASGGTGPTYSYKLDNGSYGPENVFSDLQGKVNPYIVWVKDSKGCITSKEVYITDNGSDEFEGNNSKSKASIINAGVTINARIGSLIDVDWFKFVVPVGGGIYILNLNHESINYAFNLYTSSSTIALTPVNQSSTIKEYNLIAGTYFIQISGGQSFRCYNLLVNRVINSSAKESSQTVNEIYNEVVKQDEIEFTVLNAIAYPNPSSLNFTLKIQGMSKETGVNVNVYDVIGRLVYTKSGSINDEYQFGEEFLVGVYLVKVQHGTEMVSLKVIKK